MKQIIGIVLTLCVLSTFLFGCGEKDTNKESNSSNTDSITSVGSQVDSSEVIMLKNGDIDYDFLMMKGTVLYSQVYLMTTTPEKFIGKTVRLRGKLGLYESETQNYYSCIVTDSTSCCAQGIEIVAAEGYEYPAVDTDIVVTGTYEVYTEDGTDYCHLVNTKIDLN